MARKLGDRIRKAREDYGMSATLLAERAGITRQQLYMIETNRTTDPHVRAVKAIADVLRVSVDFLLKEEDSERKPAAAALVGA
jgi:transcriptional regulator with XRE-family HTH domain